MTGISLSSSLPAFPHAATIEIRERAAMTTYQGPDGRFRVLDAKNKDWEDITRVPGPDGPLLVIKRLPGSTVAVRAGGPA